MNKRQISLPDFKNWLCEQKDLSEFFNISRDSETAGEEFIGRAVRSKVSEKKLMERIETDEDAISLVQEFLEDGGTIVSVDDKKYQIEVQAGSFYIPKFCVKVKKS
jgi:hypothetical protein